MDAPSKTPAAPKEPTAPPSKTPRPLFIYGTLCAKPLLAWAITGCAENVDQVASLLHPARVSGYRRVAVHHCDYPAVVPAAGGTVDGFVLQPLTAPQRRKLDDFEGEVYRAVGVRAVLTTTGDDDDDKSVDADVYVWDGEAEKLSSEPWDLENFVATRLEDWLDLFDGMEMVGDDTD